jgi:CheY-like chemotaxis protein
MNTPPPDFIIIDDDRTNNMICKMIIQNMVPGVGVQTFIDPEAGLAYINAGDDQAIKKNTIVLLDINMPVINGWEVLEEIEKSALPAKQYLTIYMLSSSVSPGDKSKAAGYALVSGYIEKPLSREQMQSFFPEIVASANLS